MAYLYTVIFDPDVKGAIPVCVRVKIIADTPSQVRIEGRPYEGWHCRARIHREAIGVSSHYSAEAAWRAWEAQTREDLQRAQLHTKRLAAALQMPHSVERDAE